MEKVLLYVFTASALWGAASPAEHQYHFIYQPKNWADAQTYCRAKHTDLVTVDSLNVANTLTSMLDLNQMGTARDAWIGLYEDVQSWKWSLTNANFYQGSSTQYRNWGSGQPDNSGNNEPCTEMNAVGQWNDRSCDEMRNPICVSINGQSATFYTSRSLMTWSQAQTYCRTYYTDLASIRSPTENNNVLAMKPSGDVWLGLYRDTWKWSDGAVSALSYWTPGQPDGPTEYCATAYFGNTGYFSNSGTWRDWSCSTGWPFICYGPVPSTKDVLKMKVVRNSTVDLNDAAVQTELLNQLKQKLQDRGLQGELRLSWRKQEDGKIFSTEQQKN